MVEYLLWGFGGNPLFDPVESFEEISHRKRKNKENNPEKSSNFCETSLDFALPSEALKQQ